MPNYTAGPVDLARRAKLEAIRRGKPAKAFVRAFWPDRDEMKLFQPEPGCSEPTFIGSAADMAAHSSNLLNLCLKRVAEMPSHRASVDFMPAQAGSKRVVNGQHFLFEPPTVLEEPRHSYRVLLSDAAQREIRAWTAQSKRLRGADVETGGLMFGSIDESLRVIWLDRASGPPPDSEASARQFLCGVQGTRELAEYHKRESGGSLRFIGIWHTHPVSMPQPSVDDLSAMVQMLLIEETTPRHVLMLIVGYAATSPRLAAYLFKRTDFQLLPAVTERTEGLRA
jgi:integrative and conjugative element protein (TIGR02256 family)